MLLRKKENGEKHKSMCHVYIGKRREKIETWLSTKSEAGFLNIFGHLTLSGCLVTSGWMLINFLLAQCTFRVHRISKTCSQMSCFSITDVFPFR